MSSLRSQLLSVYFTTKYTDIFCEKNERSLRRAKASHIFATKSIDIFETLHGPPMLVDKTNFGLVLYNHADFNRFEETSSYWSVKQISVFHCFSLVNQ